jgi:diguanylate cyclase (GGDEF)-like protein
MHECTVISCDLDNLKTVNDDLGHHTGDGLLRVVAVRLSACTRDRDFIARVGGDEFVLIVPESSRESADAIVERITNEVEQPIVTDTVTVTPRISVGYAIQGAGEQRVERTLARADAAMYRRKRIRAIESA